MWRLDEQVEHIAAPVLCGVRRMRRPIDFDQPDRTDGLSVIFDDEAKISAIDEALGEPTAKRAAIAASAARMPNPLRGTSPRDGGR